ncbi:hypothetical protein FLM48_15930 [Shewanella sp. Scap07]|nr:hypothetical protein FLM48_15930 [Shewanella sp. Scap07]
MDKVGHFGSFFGLAFLTHFAFKLKWLTLVTVLAGYAALIELVQSRLPYRSASFADFVADMMGVAAFMLCYWLASRYIRAGKIRSGDQEK